MLRDQARIGAYRRDIFATVPGKRVLEIGPGPAAVLSRLCLAAGAASVISVEGDPWVAEQAEVEDWQSSEFDSRVRLALDA